MTADPDTARLVALIHSFTTTHNETPKTTPPTLSLDKNRINNILTYCGAFDPPHAGHLTFLQHAFANAGRDLRFVCALIIPSSDSYLRNHKFKNESDPLILPRAVRSHLWASDPRLPPWAMVLDTASNQWADSLAQIKETASSLGVRIRFSSLRNQHDCPALNCRSLGLQGYLDNILVYLYGKDGAQRPLQAWPSEQGSWTTLPDEGDGRERYQMAIGTRTVLVRGYVRVVFAAAEREYPMRSTQIRELCASETEVKLRRNATLPTAVLSWEELLRDPTWKEWHAIPEEALEKYSGGDRYSDYGMGSGFGF